MQQPRLVASDVVYEEGVTERMQIPAAPARLNEVFAPLVAKIKAQLAKSGFGQDDISIRRSVDMRYRYQVHELNVPFPPGDSELTEADLEALYTDFDTLYQEAYGKG